MQSYCMMEANPRYTLNAGRTRRSCAKGLDNWLQENALQGLLLAVRLHGPYVQGIVLNEFP